MKRDDILGAARECVCKTRAQEYGDARRNLTMIAALWAAYLSDVDTEYLSAEDVANMMILLKVTHTHGGDVPKADNWIDIAGYAALGGEIWTEAAE